MSVQYVWTYAWLTLLHLWQVAYFTEDDPSGKVALGETVSYQQVYPGATYLSGSIHHVKLSELDFDTIYYYT